MKSLPIKSSALRDENGLTSAERKELKKALQEMKEGEYVGSFKNYQDLINSLKG